MWFESKIFLFLQRKISHLWANMLNKWFLYTFFDDKEINDFLIQFERENFLLRNKTEIQEEPESQLNEFLKP